MSFRFEWLDAKKTTMCYRATGDWNWKDYHTCVRMSLFALHRAGTENVHSLIDLRGSTRPAMPSGLAAHVRTFGQQRHGALSGRAVVIGLPAEDEAALETGEERILTTADGAVYFVDGEEAARQLLASWALPG